MKAHHHLPAYKLDPRRRVWDIDKKEELKSLLIDSTLMVMMMMFMRMMMMDVKRVGNDKRDHRPNAWKCSIKRHQAWHFETPMGNSHFRPTITIAFRNDDDIFTKWFWWLLIVLTTVRFQN
jgi:hypothetical protein